MTITIKPTLEDYKTLIYEMAKKKSIIFKDYTLVFGGITAVLLGLNNQVFNILTVDSNYKFPSTTIGNNLLISCLYNVIIVLGGIYLLRFIIYKRSIRFLHMLSLINNEIELTLGKSRLKCKRTNTYSEYEYSIIYDCEVVNEYCYISITPDLVYIVPKRTIGYDEFLKKLKEKINVR